MNRFIIGPIGVVSLLAALCAAGCAVEQTTEDGDTTAQSDESEFVSVVGDEEQTNHLGGSPMFKNGAKRPSAGPCAEYGPLPDPWKMGPLPDPWSSSSGSSGSGGGSNSSSDGKH